MSASDEITDTERLDYVLSRHIQFLAFEVDLAQARKTIDAQICRERRQAAEDAAFLAQQS